MSLRYWFPFNNNIKNLGLDTCEIINRESGFAQGKFGESGLTGHIDLISPNFSTIFNSQNFSISLWIKMLFVPTVSSAMTVYVFSCGESGTSHLLHYAIRPTTAAMAFAFYSDDYTFIEDGNYLLDVWTHFTFVFDGQKQIVYMNGRKIGERTVTAPLSIPSNSNFNLINNMAVVNDLRIYDHCLSAAEIYQLSKGLMLHCKLDQANPNIVSRPITIVSSDSNYYNGSWIFGSGGNGVSEIIESNNIPIGNKIYRIKNNTSGNKDYGQYASPHFSLIQGQKYTMSCYCLGTAKMQFRIWDSTKSRAAVVQAMNISSNTKWIRVSHTFTATADMTGPDKIGFLFGVNGAITSTAIDLCGFKVEKGQYATDWRPSLLEEPNQLSIIDSTGYYQDITSPDNVIYQPGNEGCNYTTHCYMSNNAGIYLPDINFERIPYGTINFWIKYVSAPSANSTYFSISSEDDFIKINSQSNTTITLSCCDLNVIHTPVINTWYMYTFTWNLNSHSAQIYINNQLCNLAVNDASINTTNAAEHDTIQFSGSNYCLSDIRIYSTHLSYQDVNALYKTKSKIDNHYNIFAKTFQEEQGAIQLYKNGTVKTYQFQQSSELNNIKLKQYLDTDEIENSQHTSIISTECIEN